MQINNSILQEENKQYNELINQISWFFFDLFILGYVEDTKSGLSFRLPGGLQWAVFVEVCCIQYHYTLMLYNVNTLGTFSGQ